VFFFFFQAEDGIRDFHVTGVQTCALPILRDFVIEQLHVERDDVFELDGIMGLVDTNQLITKDRPDLLFPAFDARFPERIRDYHRSEERRVGKEWRSGWWSDH